ncbi:unnamed protein product [Echinostoma caproni]|uniref:Pre-mRNA-splicing factor CWC22 n=1 Tax=Echinostoma caproni TaxID=27848 RepID=A0A183AI23_9TREM|nr:unnamed protein product [Echinostoma caproni]
MTVKEPMKAISKAGHNFAYTDTKQQQPKPKKKARTDVQSDLTNSKDTLENLWISSKDVNTRVGVLLHMANVAKDAKQLYPRQVQILPACVAFWTKNFPKWNKAIPAEAVDGLNSANTESFSVLSQTLASIYATNSKLAALADVSVAAGEFQQFLRLCHNLRRESKTNKGLNSGTLLLEPLIHEALARHFAAKADWSNLNAIFKRLTQDGLPVSKNLYFFGLECLGRLLRNATSVTLAPSHTPYSPAAATSLVKVVAQKTSNQRDLERRVMDVLNKLVNRMESEGHDITTGLMELPRSTETLGHIMFALSRVRPDAQPNLFYLPELMHTGTGSSNSITTVSEQTYSVEAHMRSVPHAMRNSFAGVFSNSDEMTQALDAQFSLERHGEVRIEPVLPPFAVSDRVDHKPVSPELRNKLLRGLMAEQDRWRTSIKIGFNELLHRLKRSHSRDKITVYPFLKILPVSQYVDLMIKAIDNMVLDSALQHCNSYLVCLRLGQSVEAACSLYRRDQLGVLAEVSFLSSTHCLCKFDDGKLLVINRGMMNCA